MTIKIKEKLRYDVHAKYGFRCAYCGEFITYSEMEIDHIIPKSKFKEIKKKEKINYAVNSYSNLNPSCSTCNNAKGSWSVQEFRQLIKMEAKLLKKNQVFWAY